MLLFGRAKHGWDNNIKTNLKEIAYEDLGCDSGNEYCSFIV
jgi:hypothetical protein